MSKYKQSKKVAFAKGYLTGVDHALNLKDMDHSSVRGSARRGYRKGIKHGTYQVRQRTTYRSNRQYDDDDE